ncbi:cob(I)yrinic acid a,c-diamide adenosyltransferase [Salibacter sp.]|jgi:cob(I)alamin adenosyltransferase|uniref:cob(I)yrinic acid a,c-diamide adenosyltransferase n=1 Tax=Salibacter sp. TaxID=2010995 RepID=UPI0028703930|nr:cob(I)yrinic acid a,c-diamide adenosyltransferase [Salibacter sp.]MDR9398041.1 cob(I)yrinic acid a,c-diamide adenosyltransferase [Salibacter sp.]MDR9486907.1 cob(I)yrinic acid a,c-diamide adenosyltransferase [Salibacter sp.]
MKIYTRSGDKGQTSLIGGTRVTKDHVRIEAYGTVDELNSWVGMLRDSKVDDRTHQTLLEIQDRLFTIGSSLATDPDESPETKLPDLKEEDITFLEKEMDFMDEQLPPMKNFILPGGHTTVSTSHICRTVCRRVERRVISLSEHEFTPPLVQPYVNRLSDYFFVLSRYTAKQLNAKEIAWKPRK